jgi:hypothetical protein
LHWWTEDYLTLLRDRKVRTAEELEAVTKEPMGVAPTQTVWIHKGLEDEARRLWAMDREWPRVILGEGDHGNDAITAGEMRILFE